MAAAAILLLLAAGSSAHNAAQEPALTPVEPSLARGVFYPRKCGRGNLRLCGPDARCGRYIQDDFLSAEEVTGLLEMMRIGMASSTIAAGPAILDIDTGYLRDTSVRNIYPSVNFTANQFDLYGSVFERIKMKLKQVFYLNHLHLTAPTFVARLRGAEDWQPASVHDEYYHPHVDADNAPHYTFSGLVYLSTSGVDFTGGNFSFMESAIKAGVDNTDAVVVSDQYGRVADTHVVQPRAGRLLLFSSSTENLHRVSRVTSGDRFTFSMWYTCDKRKSFTSFLNGKARGPLVLGDGATSDAEASGSEQPSTVHVGAGGEVQEAHATEKKKQPPRRRPAASKPPKAKNTLDL